MSLLPSARYRSPRIYLALITFALTACDGEFRWGSEDWERRTGRHASMTEALDGSPDRGEMNVVFILIDMLRADRVGSYGHLRDTTPRIDALARRGIRFEEVESQSSWTKTSMASLWTGVFPARAGIFTARHTLPDAARLPAEILAEAGYRTGGFWRNGWVAPAFGFDQGFETYLRPTEFLEVENVRRHNPHQLSLPGTDRDLTRAALDFIESSPREAFFVYLHYMDLHQYVRADDAPEFGPEPSDIYDSALRWVDQNVGDVEDALAALGLLDRTLIVIASDHGEGFEGDAVPGHARSLYKEVQHVPLILIPPGGLTRPRVIPDRVANVDIWPTLLDLLAVEPLPDAEGRSLVATMAGSGGVGSEPVERPIFAQLERSWGQSKAASDELVSVVRGPYRYIRPTSRPEEAELFDRRQDEKERANIISKRPEVAEALSALTAEYRNGSRTEWGRSPEAEIDDAKRAELRALGYIVR